MLGRHTLGSNPIRHQPLFVTPGLLQRHHHTLAHIRMRAQPCLDLAQLDTEAANLDLVIVAPQELDRAVGTPTPQIASAVHACAGVCGERVGHEAFGGQIGSAEVAARHRRAGQMQFAARADRQRLTGTIQHIRPGRGERTADTARCVDGDGLGGGDHDGFGRAVGIQQRRAGALYPVLAHGRRQRFAADDELTHAGGNLHRLRA